MCSTFVVQVANTWEGVLCKVIIPLQYEVACMTSHSLVSHHSLYENGNYLSSIHIIKSAIEQHASGVITMA